MPTTARRMRCSAATTAHRTTTAFPGTDYENDAEAFTPTFQIGH
jgi:hypothetical protein